MEPFAIRRYMCVCESHNDSVHCSIECRQSYAIHMLRRELKAQQHIDINLRRRCCGGTVASGYKVGQKGRREGVSEVQVKVYAQPSILRRRKYAAVTEEALTPALLVQVMLSPLAIVTVAGSKTNAPAQMKENCELHQAAKRY
jgi:hypothetical protein